MSLQPSLPSLTKILHGELTNKSSKLKGKIMGFLSSIAIFANIFIAQTLSLKSVPSKVIKPRSPKDK